MPEWYTTSNLENARFGEIVWGPTEEVYHRQISLAKKSSQVLCQCNSDPAGHWKPCVGQFSTAGPCPALWGDYWANWFCFSNLGWQLDATSLTPRTAGVDSETSSLVPHFLSTGDLKNTSGNSPRPTKSCHREQGLRNMKYGKRWDPRHCSQKKTKQA